ncbi:GNAT family N-acetyltransferase [Marmoricola sp. OAE513]|uniref:GNAT family N-acetyltransferase n=1 Tax=Marmoricola sp. OAE513 TaxID=2817894 RepID=UPI001DA73330
MLAAPTLRTERLVLRPFTSSDAADLYALHSNAFVLRYWDSPPWTEPARAESFLDGCRQLAEEGTGVRLAVESAGGFLGWCSLTRWNPAHRSAAIGFCYTETAWGHGFATEAAAALVEWAFESLDLHRVQAELDTRNVACARVLEKLGFVREGTLREDCVVNGVVSDSWVYGLLATDQLPGGPQHS